MSYTEDEKIFFMEQALRLAQKAFDEDEVPIGCVVVFNKTIIGSGYNRVETNTDASMHAEMIALREAAEFIGDWRLFECDLFTTLEPCTMCFGASILFRVRSIYYAAPDIRQGAIGSWVNLLEKKHPIHTLQAQGGIKSKESAALMKEFFRKKR